jgi:hypothetical protein
MMLYQKHHATMHDYISPRMLVHLPSEANRKASSWNHMHPGPFLINGFAKAHSSDLPLRLYRMD